MRLGSLCTGVGGLELGLGQVVGGELAWVSEVDAAASSVLTERFPTAPNLGDLTAIDWSTVEPVDVLSAGFPCQDLSYAGKGAGLEGARSGLWFDVLGAVRVLRPRWVVLENVGALLGRGLDVVSHGLASCGYVGAWACVRASDVGACHRRERVFIVAADTEGVRRGPGRGCREMEGLEVDGRPTVEPRRCRYALSTDTLRGESERWGGLGELAGPQGAGEGDERGGQRVRGSSVDRGAAPADPDGDRRCGFGRGVLPGVEPRGDVDGCDGARVATGDALADADGTGREGTGRPLSGGVRFAARADEVAWGGYEPAIRRHGRAVGRAAPSPVDDKGRLSPVFVEWMMMLPEGWVTDVVTTRTKALKCLGNGVVPAQAAFALRHLFAQVSRIEVAA